MWNLFIQKPFLKKLEHFPQEVYNDIVAYADIYFSPVI